MSITSSTPTPSNTYALGVRSSPVYAYSVATLSASPAATPSDVAIIQGSATKTIKVYSVKFFGAATAASTMTATLVKRSAMNTGGKEIANTTIPAYDSTQAAATATVSHYSSTAGNPTTGASVGPITTAAVSLILPGAGVSAFCLNELVPGYANGLMAQPIVLRGTAECLAVNFAGQGLPIGASNFQVTFYWTEE